MVKLTYGRFHRNGDSRKATPWCVVNRYSQRFGPFTLDVCADAETTKCRHYISRETNGLKTVWPFGSVCWCNPPFGEIYDWMEKSYWSSQNDGCTVVVFVPSWTEDRWFHEFVPKAAHLIFLRDRCHFLNPDGTGASGGLPDGMMIIVFKPGHHTPQLEFAHHAMRD